MLACKLPKLNAWVRFPLLAPVSRGGLCTRLGQATGGRLGTQGAFSRANELSEKIFAIPLEDDFRLTKINGVEAFGST
jgi:hypothetical protein